MAGGFFRNNLSSNEQTGIRCLDARLLMYVYKRNALEQCV